VNRFYGAVDVVISRSVDLHLFEWLVRYLRTLRRHWLEQHLLDSWLGDDEENAGDRQDFGSHCDHYSDWKQAKHFGGGL
jgi:hypothetical protein